MRRVLLSLVFVFFLSAALIHAATIKYSGLVDIYYRCGASVTDFGTCKGSCYGFMMAVYNTTEKPPIRVYIGNTEVPVNYTLYRVDDAYQPNLWVAEFWGNVSGPVRVQTKLSVEAYLLVNFGVGKPMYVKVLTLPYFAGRGETKPWEVRLGASGNILVCTVGKYAARGEVFYNGSWRPASVSTGWYRSVVSGNGSAVKLYWSDTPQSAIKVAYVVLTAPKGPDRAFVVGTDGLPVPAQFLSLMAGPGVVVEKDGVVAFAGTGYLTYGGRRIELKPNATVVVEGKRCLFVGQTSTGQPLDVEVLFNGKPVVSGRGQVEAFCIPGATKARYTYRMQYPITNVTYTVEADGNYTLHVVEMEIIVRDLYLRPVKSYIIKTPPNISLPIVLREYGYKTTVTAFAGKLEMYPTSPISYLLKTVQSILEVAGHNNMEITSNLYRSYQLTANTALYLSIEASILIFLISYMLLLFTKESMHNITYKFIPLLIIVNVLPLIFFNLYSFLYSFIYLFLLITFYRTLFTNTYDKQILYIFVILMFILSVSIYTGMPISYFVAWTPVFIVSLYILLFLKYIYLARRFSTGEVILNIIYVLIFVLTLLITVLLNASDRALALELTLLLLPVSRIIHTLHATYSSFPWIDLKKAKDSSRLFSAKEQLRKEISELLCRLIHRRKSEDATSFEIPPHRVELVARLVEDRADRKKFDLTIKVENFGLHKGTATMQKTGAGWALANLQVANMRESYSLSPSGKGSGCDDVAKLVGIFLLALAIVAIDTLAGLFLAIALTYVFHVVMCEGLRLGWRNALIKLLVLSIALPILVIITWSLAGPSMMAINNFRQIVFSEIIATMADRWLYVFLVSLVLFYAPIVYQVRRCLVP
ncbi:MAG: hypothetical protein ACO2PM_26350 [Pyrobaculum sp.]|jgi:hypothetical protein